MQLKEYQIRTLDEVGKYLVQLGVQKKQLARIADLDLDVDVNFAEQAWKKIGRQNWHDRQDGLGRHIPHVCLKVPTGGGKTLLAVRSLDLIQSKFLSQRTGLVLWIVPTSQIYRQTLDALRDRQHPYRQALDVASGGRTAIKEKGDAFTPDDVTEGLVVLLVMLQSSNRETKDYLKMFRDAGGFGNFFPDESNAAAHESLAKEITNLDCFATGGLLGRQVKTSLGNVIRLCQPVVVMDEGHKAYSDLAADTIRDFNPSFVLELSATPRREVSNILVDVSGADLDAEGMIKLPLHLLNQKADWPIALEAAKKRRDELEKSAVSFGHHSGRYIRPINVIQVERVGKEQRGRGFVHSEDAREKLLKLGVPAEQIIMKSSVENELVAIDDAGGLLVPSCPVRYIITNKALQEGWDCPFAYVLTILPRSKAPVALTQLVGRILRQPQARKTGVDELDSCYVFCHRQENRALLDAVKKGLEQDGLGDLKDRVHTEDSERMPIRKVAKMVPKFEKAAKAVVMPMFFTKDRGRWRELRYETDIEAHIHWPACDCLAVADNVSLAEEVESDVISQIGFQKDKKIGELAHEVSDEVVSQNLDAEYVAEHLYDIVPNPWLSLAVSDGIIGRLKHRHGKAKVDAAAGFVIDRIRTCLLAQKEVMAKGVFEARLASGEIRFMVMADKKIGFRFPPNLTFDDKGEALDGEDGRPLQRSLFDYARSEDFNEALERKVVWHADAHQRLYFWYRNRAKIDYGVQGWRRGRVFPDFIFTQTGGKGKNDSVERVYLVESKGKQLAGNEDTVYKKELFDLCNRVAVQTNPDELALKMKAARVEFHMVSETEFKNEINRMLSAVTN